VLTSYIGSSAPGQSQVSRLSLHGAAPAAPAAPGLVRAAPAARGAAAPPGLPVLREARAHEVRPHTWAAQRQVSGAGVHVAPDLRELL